MRQIGTFAFWEHVERLVADAEVVIDRPKGSAHPRVPKVIYPLDYGYLEGTTGGDGHGIDVWMGSEPGGRRVVGAVATVDLGKRDMEVKLLLNCSTAECEAVVRFLAAHGMGVAVIERP